MSEQENQNSNENPFSLIKYQAQIEISDNIDQYQKAKHNAKKLDPNPSPQDVLNNMISPRDWKTSQNKYFMQYVSHTKASRDDVLKLKQNLQQALQYRQARTQGICPIRQSLFSQTFDQIIRQVTINCPQRGLLLMRVRDQHKMSLAAYQTLYKSSIEFGMRKQLQSQEGQEQLQNEYQQAKKHHQQLLNKKIQLLSKKQSMQKKAEQDRLIDQEEREEQNQKILTQAQQLSSFLTHLKAQKQGKKE